MASPVRIKGQEISAIIIENGEPRNEFRDIRNLEVAGILEILREPYLGEKTDRRDDVYRGFRGRAEFHFSNRQILDFMRRVIDRSRRRTPEAGSVVINLQATFNFPDGDRPRIALQNLFFGEIPISIPDRSSYAAMTLDFEGEDFEVI